MDGWMHGWMDGRMDGRTDGRMDGGADGRMGMSRLRVETFPKRTQTYPNVPEASLSVPETLRPFNKAFFFNLWGARPLSTRSPGVPIGRTELLRAP